MQPLLFTTRTAATRLLVAVLLLPSSGLPFAQGRQPSRVVVGDIELHYIEEGQGEPLILLHGGQGDYRAWQPQMEALASRYRVIAYSRRYHYPNANALVSDSHSALVDAADLAGFIGALGSAPVHLVGTSYGAFTALALALEHPELVRTMVLAEPPIHQWVTGTARGAGLYREFMTTVHEPAAKAFEAGDDKAAMRVFIDAFDGRGAFDGLAADRRRTVMENARFFRAITSSSDPFPNLSKEGVRRLQMPVLVVKGADTDELHALVVEEFCWASISLDWPCSGVMGSWPSISIGSRTMRCGTSHGVTCGSGSCSVREARQCLRKEGVRVR